MLLPIFRMSVRRRVREWIVRYLPSEIAGTITALAAAWLAFAASDSLAVAAICGTIGENIGYYGVAATREVVQYWRVHAKHATTRRLLLTGWHTMRGMMVEFGVAEALDSFLVRPGLFYLIPLWLDHHLLIGVSIAKLLADLVFYALTITGYEIRKKMWPATPQKHTFRTFHGLTPRKVRSLEGREMGEGET